MSNWLAVVCGVLLILAVLWETFETLVLPRRVTRHFRMTRFFYRSTWIPYSAFTRRIRNRRRRDALLSYYGPLSLLLLLAFWAVALIFGFALVHYGDGATFAGTLFPSRFGNALYLSGTTLVTLGLGDITPTTGLGRLVTVLEAGIGFGFLALVIGYLPVMYQAFSRREVTISLLDARAGSPPTAFELLRRHLFPDGQALDELTELLHDWERWSAELMESHLSYPALAYFRSQHDNQSWIASLTVILDVCAVAMVGLEGMCQYQARMTFAIARHALVDLSQVFAAAPDYAGASSRLRPEDLSEIRAQLRTLGFNLTESENADSELKRIRGLYEPFAMALAKYLQLSLPPWIKHDGAKDNWQTTAWRLQQAQTPVGNLAPDDHH
ncbi:MAG TPA: potassium channel family protein [Candidatus Angelobacter sp.]|nr:potassium channel family protein [Candidatus Angelobacter sp.]